MPSIAVQPATVAISAATNKGRLTVASNAYLFPGTYAWVYTSNGVSHSRVKILARFGTDSVLVRIMPVRKESDGTSYTTEKAPPPRYGVSDMTAYNGSSYISMEAQAAPVDPSYATRVVP